MKDLMSQMRIVLFAKTEEKLQTALGPWLGSLQSLTHVVSRGLYVCPHQCVH